MGLKKKQVPGCGCCGSTVPPPNNCCSGTIPSTMTIQVVMSGSTEFRGSEALFGSPPGVNCRYACIDLQGTWVLSSDANNLCYWYHQTEITLVAGTCTDTGYETITVCFYLWYSLDFGGTKSLRLAIIRNSCYGGFYDILAYAVGTPASTVCSSWTVAETLTPTASSDIGGYGYCDADLDSVTVSTP